MTSIGKNCYTDRMVIDDDIVLKSLPSGKYLVSGQGGKLSYTDNTPITSTGNETIDGIKTFTSTIVGTIDQANKLTNKLNIGTNLTLASGEDEWNADTEDTINLDLDLSSYARKDQAQSFSGTQTFIQKIVGNIDTANKLKNARTIAGVSFDGSSNIDIPSTNLSDTANIALLDNTQTFTGNKTFQSENNQEIKPTELYYDLSWGQSSLFTGYAPSIQFNDNQLWLSSKDNNNETQFFFSTMLSSDSLYGQTGYLRMDVHSTEGITFNAIGKNWSSSTVPDMGFLSQTKQYNFHGTSGNRIYIDCSAFEIAKYSSGTKVSNGITFNGNLTGNASTATILQTARNIAGQSFNGGSDISIASTDLSNTVNIALLNNTQTFTGTKIFSNTITGNISGNASTATILETARTIAGQSFDGSADIDLASTGLSDTNTLIRNTDDRLTKISTNSSQNQYTYTFDLTSSNETYQTYDFKGNNSSIATFDINQIQFSANIYVLPSKYITYPYGTAGEFLKLDSSQNMVSTTLSTSDISGISNYALSSQVTTDISTAINNLNIPSSSSDLSDTANIALLDNTQTFSGAKTFTSGITASGDTFIKNNATLEHGIKIKGVGTSGNEVPVVFGYSPERVLEENGTMALCSGASLSSRRFKIENQLSGGAFLRIKNSEGEYAWGCNDSSFYIYDYTSGLTRYLLNSSGNHNFYSGNITTTGNISCADLTTSGTFTSGGDIECGFNDINNCSQLEIPATDDSTTYRFKINRPFDYPSSALTFNPKGTVTPSDQKFARFHTNRADIWYTQTSSDNTMFGNVTLGVVYGTYTPDTSASVNYQGRYWFDSNGLTLNKSYDTDLYVKSPNFVLDAGKITSTDGIIDCDNDNILTTGNVECGGLLSYTTGTDRTFAGGTTDIFDTTSGQRGMRIRNVTGSNIPILIGDTGLTDAHSETGTIVKFNFSSASTRRVQMKNAGTGAFFLKLSNSEHTYGLGTDDSNYEIYDYDANAFRYKIDSSGNHDFYSGHITTLGYGYFGSNVYLKYGGSNTMQLNTYHNTGYTYSRIYAKQPAGGGRQVRLYIMIETTATVLYRISQTLFYTNIYVSGDIDYTGDIADVSDKRTKENINNANIDNIYDNVKQIQLVNFNHTKTWSEYINKPYITKPQLGVISQQLEEINPDWVNTKNDTDKENPNPEFEDLKLVKTNQLLYSALGSIQKLMNEVEQLKQEIKILKENK